MSWCLTKSEEDKFRKALVDKKIDPFKLENISSKERRILFEKFVDSENASKINSLYESKLLLKNRQRGFQSWAKRSLGMSPKVNRDIVSKIERLQELGVLDPKEFEEFKEDLVRTRLGIGMSFEEAKNINQMAKESFEARTIWEKEISNNPKWGEDSHATRKEWFNNDKRISYGLKQAVIEKYVNNLKLKAKGERVSFKEDPILALTNPIKESPIFLNNLAKSLMASIDNSFFGRQGIKNLYGTLAQKKIWARTLAKSFKDISYELRNKKMGGFEPMDLIKADIYSRPNALNGKYKTGRYELNVLTEEVFPTSLPEKIPGLGRLFKASETAFNGSALRMRADLADMYIAKMEKQGLNALDPKQARGVGHMIGSLTGRGSLGRLTPISKELNVVLWSARFFKSNLDTLTAHQFDPLATKFTKSEARKNLLSIVGHIAGIMLIAGLFDKDSVETDPRATNFGRIKINGKWTDITGSMRIMVIMAMKLVPTKRNGEWGNWQKSSTGNWTNLRAGGFKKQNVIDVLLDTIFLNRLAPIAAIMRDYYRNEMFGGDPFNIKKSIINSATPLSIQQIGDVKDEKFETILGVTISEFFGLGVSTYKYKTNWDSSKSKEMKSFEDKVGEKKFKEANDSYNRVYSIWFEEVQNDTKYKRLSDDNKQKLKRNARKAIKEKIFKEYGFKYKAKKVKVDPLTKRVIKELEPR